MNVDDLKAAVAKALGSVRELKQQLEATDAEVDEKMNALAALDTKRESAARSLETACDQATATARQGETELRAAADAARDAITAARTSVLANAEGAVKALSESRQASVALHGQTDEADAEMKERLAEVEREIRELAGQATTLTEDVEQATQEVDRLLQEEAGTLQRLLQEVGARVEQVRETIRTECTEPIAEDEQTASTRLDDLTRTVDTSFELAETHAKESATYCIEERGRQLTEVLSMLEDAARDVTKALQTLEERASAARDTAVSAANQMNQALTEGNGKVDSAIGHIDSVLDVLAGFGFTV